MAQEPFTPTGVLQKQTDLYALPNNLLLDEANLIRSDFRQWILDNFLLDTGQQSFLTAIDDRWVALVSAQTGFAVENRLAIELVLIGDPGVSKLIRPVDNMIVECVTGGGFSTSGTLKFEMVYL